MRGTKKYSHVIDTPDPGKWEASLKKLFPSIISITWPILFLEYEGNFIQRFQRELSTKWILNTVSTGAHVLKGKILRNYMVDLRVSNTKLFDRALGILQRFTGLPQGRCREALLQVVYHPEPLSEELRAAPLGQHIARATDQPQVVPAALLCLLRHCSVPEARARLDAAPFLRAALDAALSGPGRKRAADARRRRRRTTTRRRRRSTRSRRLPAHGGCSARRSSSPPARPLSQPPRGSGWPGKRMGGGKQTHPLRPSATRWGVGWGLIPPASTPLGRHQPPTTTPPPAAAAAAEGKPVLEEAWTGAATRALRGAQLALLLALRKRPVHAPSVSGPAKRTLRPPALAPAGVRTEEAQPMEEAGRCPRAAGGKGLPAAFGETGCTSPEPRKWQIKRSESSRGCSSLVVLL
ncbi:hypothetical protein JRQ81_005550 [Phrynocephalus forsythii]|uniref:Glucokinase regulatory protein second SIS domain-containing protein n=1 Tax=Phrynocephalus forsythii TaxID=171643 RepID=A0A9Q0Y3S0_9SAUR|nr:hypothetical protein JRQ81_005550 [Phrynocephalus forsythii]